MKKISLLLFGSAISLLFVYSCASHQDVRPGLNNHHKVILESSNKQEGARLAIQQATRYCKKNKKSPVFTDEKQKYDGEMDESMHKTVKGIGKVASVLGVGQDADEVLGTPYKTEMSFSCE